MGVGASDEGVMYTLTSTDVHAVVTKNIQFDASSFDGMKQKAEQGMHHSLRTGRDSGDFVAINNNDNSKMIIRRLTPVECERLQGFPDGWADGNSDGTRYKQLGNAVTVNVSRWIAENINTFLQNANTASDTR